MRTAKRHLLRLRFRLRAFRRSQDGIAAVEFAFIAPVMIVMLLGLFEAGRAYSMFRRVTHAADMVGDLVSREIAVSRIGPTGPSKTFINDIYALVSATMGSYPINPNLRIEVIPLVNISNAIRVYANPPGFANGAANPSGNVCSYAPTSVERQLLQTGVVAGRANGLIIVRLTYDYSPLLLSGMTVPWEYKQMFVPRRSACVAFDVNCGATPPPSACSFPTG